ncbi:hypothetical protein BLNAU_9949 [Blattamonas nauphoetae]|uniref:Uncharacterized protein n=1 Tax=Blattamonas nauphoetae TaxID=2049346 RepID=A0ABQ9XU55_9EUKA|nr:hypothetical protein BLNAU_9949 [Blattamonas nauphoetae]
MNKPFSQSQVASGRFGMSDGYLFARIQRELDCLDVLNSSSFMLMQWNVFVSTLKIQPSLDVSLETKAVTFLGSVDVDDEESVDAFLSSLASNSDDSLAVFVQCIVVLISSASQTISKASIEMLNTLILTCSEKVHFALLKADLIPQLIITLNPHSRSFAEAADVHICLLSVISTSFWLVPSDPLSELGIEDVIDQQAVHETVFQQVLTPSEKYILHLYVNRYSIMDGDLSRRFLTLLANLLEISPYYQPTMDFVLNMPVVVTIPSCLAFFENDISNWTFLSEMNDAKRKWNRTSGEERQMGKTVHRMFRMEGIEDVIEEKLQNDRNTDYGRWIDANSIRWNNKQGMNALLRR